MRRDFGRLIEREKGSGNCEGLVVGIKAADVNVWMESMVLNEDELRHDNIRYPSENEDL